MGFPIGLPSTQLGDGSWEGFTPEGLQRAIGAMYNASGIVPGNYTSLGAKGGTGWTYTIPAMTVFMWISYASRRGILVPIESETLTVSAPTGGAARTDVIYVSTDGIVKVAEGATSAPSGVVLDRMVIPAGAANTQGATSNWDTVYAIPSGASLGRMAHWESASGFVADKNRVTRHTQRFYLPSDRVLRLDATSTIKAATASGTGAMGLIISVDGTWERAMSCSYTNAWHTFGSSWSAELPAGAHEITVATKWDTGDAYQLAGGISRTEVSLWDMGVSR